MFVFLSLAMVKRYAELHAAAELGRLGQTPGRGYRPSDMSMVAKRASRITINARPATGHAHFPARALPTRAFAAVPIG